MNARNIVVLERCLGQKIGATHYNAQLGLPDKGRAIKELVVCRTFGKQILHLL